MDRNFQVSLKEVLWHEGGWADNPKDPGGATMKGVTLTNFRRYVKPGATKDELRKITDEQLATVYRRFYWDAINGASLPDGLDFATFDYAVNSGPNQAAKSLQKVLGVVPDGRIGPASIEAAKSIPADQAIDQLCDGRLAFMKRIRHKKTKELLWTTFGKGWSSRVARVRAFSKDLADQPTPEKPTIIVKEKEVEVEKPVVPKEIDKEVKKNTNFWGWLVGILGTAGGGISGVLGADKQTIITFGGVAVVGLLIVLVLGPMIVRRLKAIRAEIEA